MAANRDSGQMHAALGRPRAISGALGSRNMTDSQANEIEGSMTEFGSNPLMYQERLNTNLASVDMHNQDADDQPPSNITPMYKETHSRIKLRPV